MKKYIFPIVIAVLILPLSLNAGATPTTERTKGYHVNKNFDVVPNNKNDNRKVILITIDDGPSKYGNDMMKTLQKHNAKAIFFVNGVHNKKYPYNIKMQHDAGFSIGNHTWNHINLKQQKNKDKIKKEIDDNTKLILKATGSSPKFFRAPFGVSTPYVKEITKADGMIYMNWSGSAKDWEKNTKEEKVFIENIMKDLHPGEILLIHEHQWTAKYLDTLLTKLEQKGYSFLDPKDITN